MLLHRRKIAVVVQQRTATFDAKRADDDVGGLADRYAHVSQPAIVPGGARREIGVQERHHIEAAQAPFDARRVKFVAGALKNFKQDEVADKDPFAAGGSLELGGSRRQQPTEVGDPDRTVDEDLEMRKDGSLRISSRSPSQP